ncbi:hypothetical protein INR49_019601 [Caranx melampygus]|nr:hypothetical protein INR49_019601 [Caranx melampygus]
MDEVLLQKLTVHHKTSCNRRKSGLMQDSQTNSQMGCKHRLWSHAESVAISLPAHPKIISFNPVSSDMKLGRNVARTFLDYYKLNNLIKDNRPTHIESSEVMPQTGNGKGNGPGRDAVDREMEKSQSVRH